MKQNYKLLAHFLSTVNGSCFSCFLNPWTKWMIAENSFMTQSFRKCSEQVLLRSKLANEKTEMSANEGMND